MEAVVYVRLSWRASTRSNFHSKPFTARTTRCTIRLSTELALQSLTSCSVSHDHPIVGFGSGSATAKKQADRAVGYLLFPLLGLLLCGGWLPRTRILNFSMYLHAATGTTAVLPVRPSHVSLSLVTSAGHIFTARRGSCPLQLRDHSVSRWLAQYQPSCGGSCWQT